MTVDVFGRQLIEKKEVYRGPPGIGFSLTSEANFDIQNKRLCNIQSALDLSDAVTLNALNILESNLRDELQKLRELLWKLDKKFDTFKNTSKPKSDLSLEIQERIRTNKV